MSYRASLCGKGFLARDSGCSVLRHNWSSVTVESEFLFEGFLSITWKSTQTKLQRQSEWKNIVVGSLVRADTIPRN